MKFEMSPSSNKCGRLKVYFGSLLERNLKGITLVNCSIQTIEGIKVADVA